MFEKYEDAQKCFAEAIRIDPDFARAWRNYGYVCYCIEKKEQIDRDPDPDKIDNNEDQINEKLDEVIEYLNKVIELDPQDPYVWHYRALVHFYKREYENAMRDFERAIQIRFSFYDAWYGKAMVFDSKGQYKEAQKCFNGAINWCEKGIEKKEISPKMLVERKKLAYMYNSKGMSIVNYADSPSKDKKVDVGQLKKDAIKSFDKAISEYKSIEESIMIQNEKIKNKESSVKIETALGKGLALFNRGYAVADSVVNATKNPAVKEKYEDATESLKDAIACFKESQQNPSHKGKTSDKLYNRYISNTWRVKGFVHAKLAEISSEEEKQKQHRKAFECFKNSTEIVDSSFALAWNSRGYHIIGFLKDLENYNGFNRKDAIEKARDFFDKAIVYGNQSSWISNEYVAWFYYNKGYTLYTSGMDSYDRGIDADAKLDFEAAKECFAQALNYNPKYHDAWCIRAISLYYFEQLKDGRRNNESKVCVYTKEKNDIIKFLDKSLELYSYENDTKNDKNFSYAWYYKGIVLASLGRYEEAVKCFDESTGLNWEFGEAWYRKGVSFYSLQNYKLAIECFDKAEECYNNDRENNIKYYYDLCLIRGQSRYNVLELKDSINDLHEIPDDEKTDKKILSRKYLNLGLIYSKLEDFEMAEKMYKEAEWYGSDLADIYYNLAILYSKKNETKEAIKSLEKCRKILDGNQNGKEEIKEKAREAQDKYRESRQTDWYQWWVGRSTGRKVAGIVLIGALISFIVSPIIIMDRGIIHLINSNSSDFTAFITGGVTAQTVAAFTLAIGALLAILLLPSLQKFKVAAIELETVPVSAKDQEAIIPPPVNFNAPLSTEMPLKITAPYFRMPLRYEMQQQVYTPIDPAPAPTKYKKVLFARSL